MKGWWIPQPHLYYFHYNSLPFSLMKSSFIFFSLISFSLWLSSHTFTFTFLTCMSTNLRCISKKKKKHMISGAHYSPRYFCFLLSYLFIYFIKFMKRHFHFQLMMLQPSIFYNYFLCWIIVRWSCCWEKKGNRANVFEINASGWEKKG